MPSSNFEKGKLFIRTMDGETVAILTGRNNHANGEFIVKACNRDHLFDELVGMLSKTRQALNDAGYARIVLECESVLAEVQA